MSIRSIPPLKSWKKLQFLWNSQTAMTLGLALAAGVTLWQQAQWQSSKFWVNHALDVLENIQNEKSAIIQSQFDLSRYFLKNSSLSLTQYQSQKLQILAQLENLKKLTVDNAIQQQNLAQFQLLLERRFQEEENLIRQQESSSQHDLRFSQYQTILSGELNQQLTKIEREEQNLLDQRRSVLSQRTGIMTVIILISLLLTSIVAYLTSQERRRQHRKERKLNTQLELVEIEQDLSNHLLACRTKEEAYEILRSFFDHLMPLSSGAIFEINNSRDQLQKTVAMGQFPIIEPCHPKECWALRQGQNLSGKRRAFALPCQLCKKIYPQGTPQEMLCLPLQAHEQMIGILHLSNSNTETVESDSIVNLTRQVALPLAVLHLQAELENQTFRDGATGLWNRRFMDASIPRIFARSKRLGFNSQEQHPVGIIFGDIDHFKAYNTEFGHETGDIVLRAVAKFLQENCRDDDLACRYGGEEFVLVLPDTNLEGTTLRAESIRQGIKQLAAPGNRVINMSFGVAVYPQHGTTPQEVLRAANMALLKAKTEGRDRTLISSS